MPCMAALPDGTFLLLNGAHQGVAGFGLANDPALTAFLYDPALPVGERMSILNTTIVARLYHSEATLLPDGRVLVSGSDPQDDDHPEEFRVEVRTDHVWRKILCSDCRDCRSMFLHTWRKGTRSPLLNSQIMTGRTAASTVSPTSLFTRAHSLP